jgi:hypothetical protein
MFGADERLGRVTGRAGAAGYGITVDAAGATNKGCARRAGAADVAPPLFLPVIARTAMTANCRA